MSPAEKVQCVKAQMEKHFTAMCGDGGFNYIDFRNDAGALKQAHTGIALSEAESSVVGHFSSRKKSLLCCVDLILEARCSLDVSFAAYKFLLIYGEAQAIGGMFQSFFAVNVSQIMQILTDGMTVPISWALTMASPADKLCDTRPTARLLGPETIASVLGGIIINAFFVFLSVLVLFKQSFFKCHEFDSTGANFRLWWQFADSYESSVTSTIITIQVVGSALAYNIGSKYRRGGLRNTYLIIIYAILVGTLILVLMGSPNSIGCLLHINCGSQIALKNLGYTAPMYIPDQWFSAVGHNVLPVYFRWVILAICALNLLAFILWEKYVILGPIRKLCVQNFSSRPKMRL